MSERKNKRIFPPHKSLESARLAQGLTCIDVANKVGTTEQTYRLVERGRRAGFDDPTSRRLAKLFGLSHTEVTRKPWIDAFKKPKTGPRYKVAIESMSPDKIYDAIRSGVKPIGYSQSGEDEVSISNDSHVLHEVVRVRWGLQRLLGAGNSDKKLLQQVELIARRVGLLGGEVDTLQDIGNELGLTREGVRRRQTDAITRLRSPERNMFLGFEQDEGNQKKGKSRQK